MNRTPIIHFSNWEFAKLETNFRTLWGVVQSNQYKYMIQG